MRRFLILLFLCFLSGLQPQPSSSNVEEIATAFKKTLVKHGMKPATVEDLKKQDGISVSELTVDLRNPSFSDGVLITSEGGVIKNNDLRIQAKNIRYTKKKEQGRETHQIEAENDLMVIYKNRVFVGQKLKYDFMQKQGVIYQGKTYISPWYLGGDEIELKADGQYIIKEVSITTCESSNSAWDIYAQKIKVEKRDLLAAEKVRLRIFKAAALWLPSFKINMKSFLSKPIIRYKIDIDKPFSPRISLRYQIYSWRDFALFIRGDYRLAKSGGGALETEYFPEHKRSSFVTKNYVARDLVPNDPHNRKRYRFQGAYHGISENKKTSVDLTWDKYSDIEMPADFKSADFEINTAKKTELNVRNQKKKIISILHAQHRANPFNTLKQDLPSLFSHIHPFKWPQLGLSFSNWLKIAYLDYAYSDKLKSELFEFKALRAQFYEEILRKIDLKALSLTPYVGVTGLFYSDSPSSEVKPQGTFFYGCTLKSSFYRDFTNHQHLMIPYAKYEGYSKPLTKNEDVYIFSIADGFHRLDLVKIGLKNSLISLRENKFSPVFEFDLYSQAFLHKSVPMISFPKGYWDLRLLLSSFSLINQNAWNIEHNQFDYAKLRLGWTASEDLALSVEYRYRSQYAWRKAAEDNFILDITRNEKILLESPVSDRRHVILSRLYCNVTPYVSFEWQSHHGFGRKGEPPYNEFEMNFFVKLATAWKIKLGWQHTKTDNRFTFDYFLLKI